MKENETQGRLQYVITYSSPSGYSANFTEGQIEFFRKNNCWPKDIQGEEFCQVSHGRHLGFAINDGKEEKL